VDPSFNHVVDPGKRGGGCAYPEADDARPAAVGKLLTDTM